MNEQITVESIHPSDTVESKGAVDAVVTVHDVHGNHIANGDVTLTVDRDGVLVAWGSRENWLSRKLRDLDEDILDAIVREIRVVAAAA